MQELEQIVGVGGVCRWQDVNPFWQKQIQETVTDGKIEGIVYPNTQAELAAVTAWAAEQDYGILPCGSGSKLDWGGLVKSVKLVVSTQRLNQLIEHAVGDLTVTVEAGMKFATLQQILAKENQFLPLDPAYPDSATIGGIVATADTGSLRQRYRGVRDLLLGISLIRSDGQLAKAGGRVVKNVAGYDLMKLLAGSYGTLGIISQVTLRVYPLASASETVFLTGEPESLQKATQVLLTSSLTPVAIDVLSKPLATTLDIGKAVSLAVRFQSIPESVKEQSGRLLEIGATFGLQGQIYPANDESNFWQQLKQLMWTPATESSVICKLGMRPGNALQTLSQWQQVKSLIHVGSGLGVLQFDAVSAETLLQIRQQCETHGGFLTVLKGPGNLKQQLEVWGYNGTALPLMQRIKQQFDPDNLLSPDRFFSRP